MKRLLKIICVIIVSFFLATSVIYPTKNASATDFVDEFTTCVNKILNDYVKYTDRVAGSENEADASEYIRKYLSDETDCSPSQEMGASDGVQKFRFTSTIDGKNHYSQNIIFTYNSGVDSGKKVILACSYDSLAYKYKTYQLDNKIVSSQSVNGSAASVALLLAFAKYLPDYNYDFNLEFIFFGAGESNNAGSKYYTEGISSEKSKEILLMINFDKIAIGKNLYFYSDEVETKFSKYFSQLLIDKKLDMRKISIANIGKVLLTNKNDLGLDYTHIALTSNNINFMAENILSLNIFSGDYSSDFVMGLCEVENQEVITYTDYDNLEYIFELYGEDYVSNNLFSVFTTITTLFGDSNFKTNCEQSAGQTNWLYNIFANEKLVAYLSIASILIFVCVAFIINYKLTKKSYYADIEKEFVSVVFNITDNVSLKNNDKDLTKLVSEKLVYDIKKDKKISRKKNKK